MKNKVIILVGVLVVIALFFAVRNVSFAPTEEMVPNENQDIGIEKIKINPETPDITLPLSNAPKDVAWAVFQTYLNYNKNRNFEGVKSVVYKIAPVCKDPKTRIDCEARMGSAYAYGNLMKKEDFTNVWSDEKQIILSSNFKVDEDNNIMARTRSIIFFIKDQGNWKMLSFSPFKGATINKGTASQEELNDRLITYTEDKDQDGIASYEEECISAETKDTCVPTNPKTRDTNGDGWWDGVEALMNG